MPPNVERFFYEGAVWGWPGGVNDNLWLKCQVLSWQSSVQIISTPCGNSVSINPEQEHENSNSGQCWSRVQVSTQGSVQVRTHADQH